MARWFAFLVLILAALGAPAPARAAPDIPTYVSDQFRTVAKRTIAQITADAIAKACPANQPLCAQVVARLGEAFSAAVAKDDVALRSALNSFFIDSSVSSLLQVTVADALHDDAFAGD